MLFRVRGYVVMLVAAVGIACGQVATLMAPHTAPVGAVVVGRGSGLHTNDACRAFWLGRRAPLARLRPAVLR